MGADDTRGAWIRVGIDGTGGPRWKAEANKKRKIQPLVEWRSRRIWGRVRKGRVRAHRVAVYRRGQKMPGSNLRPPLEKMPPGLIGVRKSVPPHGM